MAAQGIQFIDGFDTWATISELTNSQVATVRWTGSGLTGTSATAGGLKAAFITGGRQGLGQALVLSVIPADVFGIFDARVRATFSTGAVQAIADTAQMTVGFNAYLGMTGVAGLIANTGGVVTGGYARIWGFSSTDVGAVSGGLQSQKITYYYNQGTNSFCACFGSGSPPGGTGVPLVPFVTGTPSRNPWQQWTYFEFRVYRSATSGQVDLWVENSAGTLEHVLAGNALDTSIATRGALSGPWLGAGFFSQTAWFPIAYDDFWEVYSTGAGVATIGVPSYVITLSALAESTQSGAVWTASSGTNNATVVAEQPVVFTDYTSAPISQTGALGNSSMILFTQNTLPYTPASIAAIQASCWLNKTGSSGNTAVGWARIRKSGADYDGVHWTLSFVSGGSLGLSGANSPYMIAGNVMETDPDTSAAWVPATANAVLFGPTMSGSTSVTGAGVGVVACFGAYMFVLASIASGVPTPPGGPQAGYGQPFWMIQTG